MSAKKSTVKVGEHSVVLSNLDKVLYPTAKIIKAELIQYYMEVAPYIMRFGKGRILSLRRFPDGIQAASFYSKDLPEWTPEWIKQFSPRDDDNDYLLLNKASDLAWIANLAGLEIHAMSSHVDLEEEMVDHLILDFDPPSNLEFAVLRDLLMEIKVFLEDVGHHPFVKTSGSKGAHIYLPIHRTDDRERIIEHVKLLANQMEKAFPNHLTNAFRKDRREGKMLIDINRNHRAQTCVLPFSTRAIAHAPVSMPISWRQFEEVESSQEFTIRNVKKTLENHSYGWLNFEKRAVKLPSLSTKKNRKIPVFSPMLCESTQEIPQGDQWVFENKWDGIRVLITIRAKQVIIRSKSGRDISAIYPEIRDEGKTWFSGKELVLDGEIVVLDERGIPAFSRVISRLHSKTDVETQMKRNPAVLYVFDLLWEGKNCSGETWKKRRERLKKYVTKGKNYRLSEAFEDGELLYEAAKKWKMEGIMIKHRESPYLTGARSHQWLKLKFRTLVDAIILGYTDGSGDRSEYFGSLHVGEVVDGKIVYRGRVGSGFDFRYLQTISSVLKMLQYGSRNWEGKPEELNHSYWVVDTYPECELSYASLTSSGHYREPVFKKLKETVYVEKD